MSPRMGIWREQASAQTPYGTLAVWVFLFFLVFYLGLTRGYSAFDSDAVVFRRLLAAIPRRPSLLQAWLWLPYCFTRRLICGMASGESVRATWCTSLLCLCFRR